MPEVLNILLAVVVGGCIGGGLVFWWVARSTDVTADREINGWPAYHIGYLAERGQVAYDVRVYAVREASFRWHLWAVTDGGPPVRISYDARASKAEIIGVAYRPGASQTKGQVIVPVDR